MQVFAIKFYKFFDICNFFCTFAAKIRIYEEKEPSNIGKYHHYGCGGRRKSVGAYQ